MSGGEQIEVRLSASVLGLRGEITQQPIIGKRGILGWNGQVRLLLVEECILIEPRYMMV